MFKQEIYSARRRQLKATVKQGLILLLGNEESSMNYTDNLYHFRQDSSFLYFIGIDQPTLAAVIDIDNDREILFGNELTMLLSSSSVVSTVANSSCKVASES